MFLPRCEYNIVVDSILLTQITYFRIYHHRDGTALFVPVILVVSLIVVALPVVFVANVVFILVFATVLFAIGFCITTPTIRR
jgi:hypothetical protein